MARRSGTGHGSRIGGRGASLPLVLLVLAVLIGAVLLERADQLPPAVRDVVQSIERDVFGTDTLGPSRPRQSPGMPPPGAPIDFAAVRTALATIRVEPERRGGYDRDAWPHWLPVDGGCLNVREKVLIDESMEPAQLSRNGCTVLSGLWNDAYTGETLRDPRQIDIDHVVALEEAYQSGGYDWTREQRAAYANDRSDARTLIGVSRSVNRAKGSKGPEEWLPPDGRYRCHYIADWIRIKARWRLSMDESERIAVGNILTACQGTVSHWNKSA